MGRGQDRAVRDVGSGWPRVVAPPTSCRALEARPSSAWRRATARSGTHSLRGLGHGRARSRSARGCRRCWEKNQAHHERRDHRGPRTRWSSPRSSSEEGTEEHHRVAQVTDEDQQHHRRARDKPGGRSRVERRQHDPGEFPRPDHEHLPGPLVPGGRRTTMQILASSVGWSVIGPTSTARKASLVAWPLAPRQDPEARSPRARSDTDDAEGLVVAQEDDRHEENEAEDELIGEARIEPGEASPSRTRRAARDPRPGAGSG